MKYFKFSRFLHIERTRSRELSRARHLHRSALKSLYSHRSYFDERDLLDGTLMHADARKRRVATYHEVRARAGAKSITITLASSKASRYITPASRELASQSSHRRTVDDCRSNSSSSERCAACINDVHFAVVGDRRSEPEQRITNALLVKGYDACCDNKSIRRNKALTEVLRSGYPSVRISVRSRRARSCDLTNEVEEQNTMV